MHYKNGKPAKVGDLVLAKINGVPETGVVVLANAACDTCNLVVAPLSSGRHYVTAGECALAEDALAACQPAEPTEKGDQTA